MDATSVGETIPVPGGEHKDPNECLKLQPKKSILKVKQPSFDTAVPPKKASVGDSHARFDEMNILQTYHPTDKDYGHMKIDEPKTPFHIQSDSEEDAGTSGSRRRVSLVAGVDAEKLAEAMEKNLIPNATPAVVRPGEDDGVESDKEHMSAEDLKHKIEFEKKRRAHYDEGAALRAGKDKMLLDDDDEE
uniref:Protein phosphatase inhibitor 2 n=1 Tax=Steinernema glaseri TaxID=37863 RepID=A0A1I8A1S8_9BILA